MNITDLSQWMNTSVINQISLNDLIKKYSFTSKSLINGGNHGYFSLVFSLLEYEDLFVGKFLRKKREYGREIKLSRTPDDASILNYEFKFQKELFDKELKVPKPEGVYLVKLFDSPWFSFNNYFPALVMRDLGRLTLDKLKGPVLEKAKKMRDIEFSKAYDLGFEPSAKDKLYDSNAIWVPQEEQTYLIDFLFWKRRKDISL